MDERVKTQGIASDILEASQIVIWKNQYPRRVLIRENRVAKEYIVCFQTLKGCNVPEGRSCSFEHAGYFQVQHFSWANVPGMIVRSEAQTLLAALQEYKERLKQL